MLHQKEELKKLEIRPEEIKTVLLTHSDIDHVYGLEAFRHADIYLSEAEVAMLGQHRIVMTESDWKKADENYGDFTAKPGQNL